ncbi:MAG: hypothetical protein F6J90_12410 [Moorea sp. SIOASIH]|uniref:hypothetical protein n=1 Tax=Moorena sp. SIOASIH TaxID=2607817 RepID=UPI0013BA45FF|nr:hypothetical protein [Moorena sp. SIOASIH]NEO37069.1 hypothetical protein [Moorena sp. SIOASIH]
MGRWGDGEMGRWGEITLPSASHKYMGLGVRAAWPTATADATRSHGCLTVRLSQRLGFRNGYH